MLHDPARHEPLRETPWDPGRAKACIERIVDGLDREFEPGRGWAPHPQDDPREGEGPNPSLYFGATGVIWALDHLCAAGAAAPRRREWLDITTLIAQTRAWLGAEAARERSAYLMSETPIRLLEYGRTAGEKQAACGDELARLIEANIDHPARELMWGSPGTLLAAQLLQRRSGEARWATLFRRSAARLMQTMQWSPIKRCWYWQQDLYGRRTTYLDAVHGLVATALPLIAGRELLPDWPEWRARIVRTVQATAIVDGGAASWPVMFDGDRPGAGDRKLMQYCHGAPGFVVCLAGFPDGELDALLVAAGEATWRAGPLAKGSNLCHGTAGNGYALLKLFRRTGDERWLARARAFAMHAIAQFEAALALHGRLRASLWTGDAGLAIYLRDCLRGEAAFPTLDVFFAGASTQG